MLFLKVGEEKLSIDPLLTVKGEICVIFTISLQMGKNLDHVQILQNIVRISSSYISYLCLCYIISLKVTNFFFLVSERNTGFSIKHFSFFKEPIGNDNNYDISIILL